MAPTDLTHFTRLAQAERGLCIVTTLRAAGTIQASVVNAGVLDDPATGAPVVGFVARGDSLKLTNLRARPLVTVVARSGWDWAAVEGRSRIVGPDDPAPSVDAEARRVLLRAVFAAAGGEHDDWDTYDQVMARERRAAVLVTPQRVYSNG